MLVEGEVEPVVVCYPTRKSGRDTPRLTADVLLADIGKLPPETLVQLVAKVAEVFGQADKVG